LSFSIRVEQGDYDHMLKAGDMIVEALNLKQQLRFAQQRS